MSDAVPKEVRSAARRAGSTVSEWVRQALREARQREPERSARSKLDVLRVAVQHAFPPGDIDAMLDEIERGYADAAPR